MAANVTRFAMTSPGATLAALRGIPAAMSLLLRSDSPKYRAKGDDSPRQLDRAELKGYAAGPFLAVWSTLRARRHHRRDESQALIP
jgi:hypothetical protein